MSLYDQAVQEAVEQGIPRDVAIKAINKLWGYNVKILMPWAKSSVDFTIYTELKDGTQFDTIFNLKGGIIRRKMIKNGK
jgi:hypothetical protein